MKGMPNQFHVAEKVNKNRVDESGCIKLYNPLMVVGTLRIATSITLRFDFSKLKNTC